MSFASWARLPKAGLLSLECTAAVPSHASAGELRTLAALIAGLAGPPAAALPGVPLEARSGSHPGPRTGPAPAKGATESHSTCGAGGHDNGDGAGRGIGEARRRALVALLALAPGLEGGGAEAGGRDSQVRHGLRH